MAPTSFPFPLATTPQIHALLPQVPGDAQVQAHGYGEGATGWGNRLNFPAANGDRQIEATSIGLTWTDAAGVTGEYNVYEPQEHTFEQCVAATIPKASAPTAEKLQEFVTNWLPYNKGWTPGNGVVIPNSPNAPVFPDVTS